MKLRYEASTDLHATLLVLLATFLLLNPFRLCRGHKRRGGSSVPGARADDRDDPSSLPQRAQHVRPHHRPLHRQVRDQMRPGVTSCYQLLPGVTSCDQL